MGFGPSQCLKKIYTMTTPVNQFQNWTRPGKHVAQKAAEASFTPPQRWSAVGPSRAAMPVIGIAASNALAGVKAPRWAVHGLTSALQPQAGSDGTDRPASNYGRGSLYGQAGIMGHANAMDASPGALKTMEPDITTRPASTLHSLWDGGGDRPALIFRPKATIGGTQWMGLGGEKWRCRIRHQRAYAAQAGNQPGPSHSFLPNSGQTQPHYFINFND